MAKAREKEDRANGSSSFPRKIDFHGARKPFSASGNGGGANFRLQALNPKSEHLRHQGGKKSDTPDILESGFDPELSLEITVRRIGAGLKNLGNTCFLNSVLQCLTYTEPLAAYLQSGKHQISCHIAGYCVLCAIQKHVSRARQLTGKILAPKDLVSNLRCISRNFRIARQEDAHEYMVNLLESMHRCCLPLGVPSESPTAYENSLVHNIFGGRLRSQVKCMQCSNCSNKFDPFLDLSLEIMKADSLHKALLHFTATEQLDGGERQYQCEWCRQKVKALKQLTIHNAPYVLTIHLKRFAAYDPGKKIDKKIHFGPTLDLKPFVSGSNEEELKYTLYGVLVHAGWSTRSGHYYCFVRTSSGVWYALDDNRVFQVNERSVLDQKAYMLFYVRDRRKISLTKPVVVRKESFTSNLIGQKACLFSSQAVEVENGPFEIKVNDITTSVSQKIVPNIDTSMGTLSKDEPMGKINVPAMVNGSTIKWDCALESSLKMPSLDLVKGLSIVKSNVSESTPEPVNHPVGSINKQINGFTKDKNLNGDSRPTPCNDPKPKGLNTEELASGKTSQKVECIANESTALEPVGEKTNETVQGLVTIGLAQLSSPSVMASKSSDVKSCGRCRKSKRKLPKYGLLSLRLCSRILMQKKHRRRRHCRMGTDDLYRENFDEMNCVSADMGPSTSQKTKSTSSKPNYSGRRSQSKSRGSVNSAPPMEHVDTEFKKRISQSSAILDGNKQQPEKRASSSPVQPDVGESRNLNFAAGERVLTQNTNMKMNTVVSQDFEDTTVTLRSDMGLQPRSPILESVSIEGAGTGYVLDEWNEEYDRGKRKKVRQSKRCFGGPNPFQEIAGKPGSKKLKADGSRANQPFRIL